jgi:hypothetical protein
MMSIVPPLTELKLRLMHSFRSEGRSVDPPSTASEGVGDRTLTEPQQSPTGFYASSARSAFASFKSAVSKPSVNQP